MTTEFHIYPETTRLSVVLDESDPQRNEIMDAIAAVFNGHGHSREADECLKIGKAQQ
jgi:hypothetical protein